MPKRKAYDVHWSQARTYQHPNPERAARVGYIPGHGDRVYFEEWPTREAMLEAYYRHGNACGIGSHWCIVPVVKN